jgi:hypothetical protein
MQVRYEGGPLDGGREELSEEQLPADRVLVVAVRDQGPSVLRAGIWLHYDGQQHVYSWIPYRGLMRFEGSQALPEYPPTERHVHLDAVLV